MKKFTGIAIMAMAMLALASCGAEQETGIVAHRGFWNCEEAGYAKNSLASLKCAQEAGFWGSECDVHMTSDEVLIIWHDSDIDGQKIEANPFSTFQDVRLKNGEPIPTFAQYLEQVKNGKETVLVCELKPHSTPELEDRFLELAVEQLKSYDLFNPEKVIFISFSFHICEVIAEKYPEFTNQYLESDKTPAEVKAAGINGIDYDLHVLAEHPEWIREAHDLGMTTNAWTPTNEQEQRDMLSLGLRYITTDDPLLTRKLFEELKIKEVK